MAQLRVGGQAARHNDELLGRRHGLIGQETTGVGGFVKALRTVPIMLDIASDTTLQVSTFGGHMEIVEVEELAALRRQVLAAPHRWIAQEAVSLSTSPVFDDGVLAPRHVDLRAFVFHTGEAAEVAPAALTRVAPEGSLIVNSSRGGGSKDTWVLRHPNSKAPNHG